MSGVAGSGAGKDEGSGGSIKNNGGKFAEAGRAQEEQYFRKLVKIDEKEYPCDQMTNVTPKILSYIGKNLHLQKYHPLSHIKQRIINYMNKRYLTASGSSLFSVHEQFHPVVTLEQDFDSVLVPKEHEFRKRSYNYYVNEKFLLRSHTSAHQSALIRGGFDNFLVVADVYRRDEIDASHHPVFYSIEAVRLCKKEELFENHLDMDNCHLFDNIERTAHRQGAHNRDAVILLEKDLKGCLEGLVKSLFGTDAEYRWLDYAFPFSHPAWELEVKFEDQWMELLGCGIIEQKILDDAGVNDKIGWSFGLGLDRWAMKLYSIPDIRLFWSQNSGFLSQFKFDDVEKNVKYKAISHFPQFCHDISFWLPQDRKYTCTDFYDLVRSIGGDIIEQAQFIDAFTHPEKKLTSHKYCIVYRHLERTLTQEEINIIHKDIENASVRQLGVTICHCI